jgi:archaellin
MFIDLSQKEIPIIDDDDNDAFTYKNMAYMTKCVEDFVRMRPEQWLWLHPRWRKRHQKKNNNHKFNQIRFFCYILIDLISYIMLKNI